MSPDDVSPQVRLGPLDAVAVGFISAEGAERDAPVDLHEAPHPVTVTANEGGSRNARNA
jgi:hypothetical protein